VKLYHAPGCSSCLRTKEFLAARNVDFESIDVVNHPTGMSDLTALGIHRVPVVRVGEKWVFGEYLDKVSSLLGIDYAVRQMLPPDQLLAKLDFFLAAAQRYIKAFPDEKLSLPMHNRPERDVRSIAHHIFVIPIDFIEATAGKEYKQDAPVPDWIRTADDLVAFGDESRRRSAEWFKAQTEASWKKTLVSLWGEHSHYELWERTAWHSGQHTRQLAAMLDLAGIAPPDRLPPSAFADLPMPERVWE
jgi:glutaredoxin